MSERKMPSEDDMDKLIAEAAPYADFLQKWHEHAEDIDEWLESDGEPVPAQPETPKKRTPETVPAWWSGIAASTGEVGEAGDGNPTDLVGDWWILRPTSDGGVLYIGNPGRLRDGAGWGTVIVTLPDRELNGTVLFSSVDLTVVSLTPPDAA